MAEVFPTAQRTRSISLAYSLSVAVFGETAPYTIVSMKILPETKGIDLREA